MWLWLHGGDFDPWRNPEFYPQCQETWTESLTQVNLYMRKFWWHWHWLPREVEASSLETFTVWMRLWVTWSSWMILIMLRGWTRSPLDVPPNPFWDSMCMVPLRSSSSTVPCLPSLPTSQWSTGRMLTPGISLLFVTWIRNAAFFWSPAELKESVSHKPSAAWHKGSSDYCNPFSILTLYNPRGSNWRPHWAGIAPISSWYQNETFLNWYHSKKGTGDISWVF